VCSVSQVAGRLRRWLMEAPIRRGGWPVPMRAFEQLRNVASYALGAGSANLPVEQSGELKLLDHLAELWSGREDIVVFDVGANDGRYAAAVRSTFGPDAQIHCFEPDPVSCDALTRRFGQDARTSCHRLALSAEHGTARRYTNRDGSPLGSLHHEAVELTADTATTTHEVDVDTLDRVSREQQIDQIGLLKVDVEGHEIAVLEAARNLFERDAIAVVQFEFGAAILPPAPICGTSSLCWDRTTSCSGSPPAV
jgi:FkbM family methyltransferase